MRGLHHVGRPPEAMTAAIRDACSNTQDVEFSRHAVVRCVERGIPFEAVLDAIAAPFAVGSVRHGRTRHYARALIKECWRWLVVVAKCESGRWRVVTAFAKQRRAAASAKRDERRGLGARECDHV